MTMQILFNKFNVTQMVQA